VGEMPIEEASKEKIAEMMVGKPVVLEVENPRLKLAKIVWCLKMLFMKKRCQET